MAGKALRKRATHRSLHAAVLGVLALVAGALVATGAASAGGSDSAVAYQIDAAHSGVQTDSALSPPFASRWQATFAGQLSYPLVAGGDVYVTSGDPGTGHATLYALDQQTGQVVWSQALASRGGWANAAYDAGQIFVVENDPACCADGLMLAFDAGTGAPEWTAQLPGQFMFSSPPTAGNGVVYTGGAGSGGTLYAVDEASGQILATQPVQNGDMSSPALSASSVFVSYACDQAYGFAQLTLNPLWHYDTSCEGGGGKTPVYANGKLYVRDPQLGNLILDAVHGTKLGSFALPNTSMPAPAVDATSVFSLNQGVLTAKGLTGGSVRWSFGGDGQLDTAPIALSTAAGEFVVEGSSTGMLYALNATNGSLAWSTNVGTSIPAPDEQSSGEPLTGLGAGQGLLLVPAGNLLAAYGPGECPASATSTITSGFNATRIAAGRTIWFSGALKASGLGSAPSTVRLTGAHVDFSANGSNVSVPVRDATITFSPTATTATTSYDAGTGWTTSVPSQLGGNVLLSGAGFWVPADLPGGIRPVSFTGTFHSDTPGVQVSWKWAAAVYTTFNADPSRLGVKPVDDPKASSYRNSDHAGTPEAYKQFVTAGATGGGSSNYTGDYSGTATVTPCLR